MVRIMFLTALLCLGFSDGSAVAAPEEKNSQTYVLTIPAFLFPAFVQRMNPDYADPYAIGLDYVDLFLVVHSDGSRAYEGYDQDGVLVLYDSL